jgi:hypothetical protein
MTFNRNVYPPGGRTYTEADGTVFRAGSWRDLETLIRDYRSRNGLPAGDVQRDIDTQLCAKYPNFCDRTRPAPKKTPDHHSLTFNQRVLHWIARALGLKRTNPEYFDKVSEVVAAERATICAGCPRQQGLVKSCEACVAAVKTGRREMLKGAPSSHQNLLPCSVLAEDPAITVHLKLPPVTNPNLPPACWRTK